MILINLQLDIYRIVAAVNNGGARYEQTTNRAGLPRCLQCAGKKEAERVDRTHGYHPD